MDKTLTTIYPAVAGGFAPASFWSVMESLQYIRELQDNRPPCGICSCPAMSYSIHYPETESVK